VNIVYNFKTNHFKQTWNLHFQPEYAKTPTAANAFVPHLNILVQSNVTSIRTTCAIAA
jgi:hypothetical protein